MDLENYENREHAKAKHALLERYITRYAMILGQVARELVFVDGFAGPWQSGATDRSDTSFGISATALKDCAETLGSRFGRRPNMRALWIEEDPAAFAQLSAFAINSSSSRIKIEAKNGQFQNCIEAIGTFIGETAYAFIFVDPKGYRGLIEPCVLAPLLRIPRAELLVNYMWDHIKWAFGHKNDAGHRANLDRLYGSELPRLLLITDPAELADEALKVYESGLREAASGPGLDPLKVLSYPIYATRGRGYPKYWLVHATHDAAGVTTFAEECEKTHRTQADIFYIANVNRKSAKTGVEDLFAGAPGAGAIQDQPSLPETDSWLEMLPASGSSIVVDREVWALLLERGRCLPKDLQDGFKLLTDRGILRNVDAKRTRRKRFVHYEANEHVERIS